MKAVICPKYGSPEVLQIKEIDKPLPKDNEVLIKVFTSTVTKGDCRIIRFSFASWFWLPGRFIFGFTKPRKQIPGWEVAGEIESVGKSVSYFKPGDKVFGYTEGISFGACNAQYKSITEDRVVKMDESKISYENAVVLPVGGLTALYLLRMAKIEKEQKVLIYGASGSVGTFAVQLAKYFSAEVTGICSGKNMKLVQSIGASQTIDYTKEDFTKNGQTYDVIFDAVGKTTFSKCKNSLKTNGKYLTVEWPIFQSFWTAITGKKKIIFGMAPHRAEDLIYLKELVETGKLNPVIDKVFPLEEAIAAYTYVDKGHKVGNVVIMI